MKKIIGIILTVVLTSGIGCMAQSFGIKGGLNISNISASDEDGDIGGFYDQRFGPVLGLDVLFPLAGDLQLRSGIAFSSKGAKGEESSSFMGNSFTAEASLKLYYLDLPLNVQYSILRDNIGLYVFGGPVIGIGIAGTNSVKTIINGVTEEDFEDDIRWGSGDNDDVKRLELAGRLGAGVDLPSFMIEVYYDLGINNISAFTDFDTRLSNRVLAVALVYKL